MPDRETRPPDTFTLSRRAILAGAAALGGAALAETATGRSRARFFGPGGATLGLQFYTLGDEGQKDIAASFEAVRAIGYRSIELIAWGRNSAAEVKVALDRSGLIARSTQATFITSPGLKTGIDRLIADANLLGLRYVVASLPEIPTAKYGGPRKGERPETWIGRVFGLMTEDDWKGYADTLNALGARMKANGLTMGHHNHNVDFAPVGDTTGFDIVQRHTDPALVCFELDTGWVRAAGLDPVAILARYPGRFRMMHLKDIRPTTPVNHALMQDPAILGQGMLDWATLLPAARAAGIDGFYVEQEAPFTMPRIEAARQNHAYLMTLPG